MPSRWRHCCAGARPWVPLRGANDTARHFNNVARTVVVETLGTAHQLPLALSPWTNGAVERIMPKVVRTSITLPSDRRRMLVVWVQRAQMAPWAFNVDYLD